MLRQFQALPTEPRARAMRDRDYLWCLANALLDREEEQARLCPACRSRIGEPFCPVCGQPAGRWGESGDNAAFDEARFARMREGDRP